MCTWITEKTGVDGSGKGPDGWFRLSHAAVYYDHPYDAAYDHTLNIDFWGEGGEPGTRVAVELTAESARALIRSIQAALDSGEASHAA